MHAHEISEHYLRKRVIVAKEVQSTALENTISNPKQGNKNMKKFEQVIADLVEKNNDSIVRSDLHAGLNR